MMNGYFRNPEATAAAVVDGWYHTGDLAEQDADGYYSIVGRAKDIIRTGWRDGRPRGDRRGPLTHPGHRRCRGRGRPRPGLG